MSRIGNAPIILPSGVHVEISPENNVVVKGARGSLKKQVPSEISLLLEEQKLILGRRSEEKKIKALHGLYRALLQNMVIGVSEGYKEELELVGVGYKVALNGSVLEMNIGKSHAIHFLLPQEMKAATFPSKLGAPPFISLECNEKELLGQVSAKIRSFHRKDPYKGKGIHRKGAVILRKLGKKASK